MYANVKQHLKTSRENEGWLSLYRYLINPF